MKGLFKISVIIPVYMVAVYLRECVDSVLNQSYDNIEIILVDDGSKDESASICDDYAAHHKNVIAVHKKNGGLSDARNAGICRATGDYILFLDGDDFYDDLKAIERLAERLYVTKVDVLNFSYKKYFEDTGEKVFYFNKVPAMSVSRLSKAEQLDYLTKNGLYIASACNKIIRKTLFQKDMLFKKNIYSEDIEWCARLMKHAKSMDFICENFYCYRQRKDSITHTINDKKCEDLYHNIMECFHIAESAKEYLKNPLLSYTAYQYGTFFVVQAQAENNQNIYIEKLKKYCWILAYHNKNKKLVFLNLSCKVFGYDLTCKLTRFVYRRFAKK